MANNLKLANGTVDDQAQALADLLANGYLRIYEGSQPADADTAISSQTLLAELRFASPAESDITDGVITFDDLTADSSANATGTAQFFRALKSDGTTAVMDGSVGTSSADLVMNSTAIQSGAEVAVTSWTHTVPKS